MNKINFKTKIYIGIVLILLLIISAWFAIRQNTNQNNLHFSIKSDPVYKYEIGKPIDISGQLKNVGEENLFIYTPEETLSISYEVMDPTGKRIDIPLPINDLWIPKKDDFTLIKPGESLPKIFKLHIGYEDFNPLPGIYAISVIYHISEKGYYESGKLVDLNAWTGTLKSNIIKVEIKK